MTRAAREPAHLLFLHGRSRFSLDRSSPQELGQEWLARIDSALESYGRPPVGPRLAGVTFLDYLSLLVPYTRAYRKRLQSDLAGEASSMAEEMRPTQRAARARVAAGGRARQTRLCPDCTARDRHLQRVRDLGRMVTAPLDVAQVAWLFPDVAAYLVNQRLRADVHDLLAYRLPPAGTPVIVVAHSLGSVVAADLWAEFGAQYETRLFATAGSPLAVPPVQRRLHPTTQRWVAGAPASVHWWNVLDPVDPITMAAELRPPFFSPRITNLEVTNGRHFHSESRYLGHVGLAIEVARAA